MPESSRLETLLERLKQVQQELEQEAERLLAEKRQQFSYRPHRGRVVFEHGIHRLQRQYRTGLWTFFRQAHLSYVLSAPVIYAMIVPLALLDLSVTLYQHICFRVYGIPLVRRREYVVIDRHYLPYLNLVEKLNCAYCGYGNGVIAYAREITARTEQFWCPIKHARRARGAHQRTRKFFDYGDGEAWKRDRMQLRRDWEE